MKLRSRLLLLTVQRDEAHIRAGNLAHQETGMPSWVLGENREAPPPPAIKRPRKVLAAILVAPSEQGHTLGQAREQAALHLR